MSESHGFQPFLTTCVSLDKLGSSRQPRQERRGRKGSRELKRWPEERLRIVRSVRRHSIAVQARPRDHLLLRLHLSTHPQDINEDQRDFSATSKEAHLINEYEFMTSARGVISSPVSVVEKETLETLTCRLRET